MSTNITVHYMKKGCDDNDNRTMLILLHGFLDFWFIWNRQIAALGEEFWYMLPFRHPVVPEQYLIMNDLEFFNKVHKGFTEDEENAHKYVFAQDGALTGAINYYRAFNNDSDQLKKFPYRKINVTTLILWGVKDAFLTTPVAKYNRKWLKSSTVVYYRGAGHWLLRECSTEVTEQIRSFTKNGKHWRLHTMRRQYVEACTECAPPGESWLSTLLPWLPLDASVPTFNGE
ncbi:hypothetical protein V5799_021224 [Amblyomma americanum]|uniref:Soluble epoxide hydrolase n=1 Tax=Amblyomma americanum TaxID=6943 RepID=A0AAQ4FP61_AMBAM